MFSLIFPQTANILESCLPHTFISIVLVQNLGSFYCTVLHHYCQTPASVFPHNKAFQMEDTIHCCVLYRLPKISASIFRDGSFRTYVIVCSMFMLLKNYIFIPKMPAETYICKYYQGQNSFLPFMKEFFRSGEKQIVYCIWFFKNKV
jgi:hypothetical protein